MTRTTLIAELVDAHVRGDDNRFSAALSSLIGELRARQHRHAADELARRGRLASAGSAPAAPARTHRRPTLEFADGNRFVARHHRSDPQVGLLRETPALKTLHSLLLDRQTSCLVSGLARQLRRSGPASSPGATVVIDGPPGNGKSSLGEAIAHEAGSSLQIADCAALTTMTTAARRAALKEARVKSADVPSLMLFDDIGRLHPADVPAGDDATDASARAGQVARDVVEAVVQWPTPGLTVLVFARPSHADVRLSGSPRIHLPPPTVRAAWTFLHRLALLLGTSTKLPELIEPAILGHCSYLDLESLARNVRQLELLLPRQDVAEAVQVLFDSWHARLLALPAQEADTVASREPRSQARRAN